MSASSTISGEPTFSVVIPTRNEEANALAIAAAVIHEMEAIGDSFELIFIDNASTDGTVELLRELCAHDPRVKLIANTRNFGQMRSPTHGIFQARGKAIINLCADFQDPPTLIPRFVERWRAGVEIVLGVRSSEKSSFLLGTTRDLAYWTAHRFADYPIIRNATGFGIYDRKVVEVLSKWVEPEPFFRGMLVETGFTVETIAYPRPPRAGGKSNNDFLALLDFTLSGLAGSFKRLIRVPFYLGALTLIAAAGALFFGLVLGLLGYGWFWFGFGWFELHFGALFVFLGMIGDQVRLISERTRHTPLVVERTRINFDEEC